MKRIVILFTIISIFSTLPAQDTRSQKDSTVILQSIQDSLLKIKQDEIQKESLKQMDSNLSAFVKMQKERDKKQKQQLYVRIALGGLFLIVLIMGLMRRRKTIR